MTTSSETKPLSETRPAEADSALHAEALLLSSGRLPDQDGGVKAIVDLAQKACDIQIGELPTEGLGEGLPARVPVLMDPRPGAAPITSLKNLIESYRRRPERRVGTAKVTTLASFIDLVNRHKNSSSVIFAATAWPEPKLRAVIDYHQLDGEPRHGAHCVDYAFPLTEEFKAWIGKNNKLMEQADFAAFLEEHAAELTSPFDGEKTEFEHLFKEKMATPNELVALSRDLEIFVGHKVKRAERLSSGERTVEFVEEHLGKNGEKVAIPGIFMIAVPAFVDGEPIRIPARLRYRAGGGTISWGYQLWRWEHWMRQQVKFDLDRAAEKTALPAFEGQPET
jgi:uncharacterized protein YfdQ (DUF2303 family)